MLTIGLDFYTITTAVSILPTPVGAFQDVVGSTQLTPSVANLEANAAYFVAGEIPNDFSQDALDRLVEIVSQRGQPVIMGTPTMASNAYTFKFAIEHGSAWGVTANASSQPVPMLANAIQTGGIDFGFNLDTTLTVTVSQSF
ncbi:unnamed protein product [Sphagnum tenellum]